MDAEPGDCRGMTVREKVAIALLGAGTGWNMGNIGPIVTPISEEFSVSLAAVGLLSSGVLCAALLMATFTAPSLMQRIGAANGARAVCGCIGVGNVILAVAPAFGVALGARALIGYGAGLAFIFGPARPLGNPIWAPDNPPTDGLEGQRASSPTEP